MSRGRILQKTGPFGAWRREIVPRGDTERHSSREESTTGTPGSSSLFSTAAGMVYTPRGAEVSMSGVISAVSPAMLVAGFGIMELLLIFLIIVVIFGASKLPQLGRGLGEGISNFKTGLKGKDESKSVEEKNRN
jgi:sec-independent protein translocase protein TatA